MKSGNKYLSMGISQQVLLSACLPAQKTLWIVGFNDGLTGTGFNRHNEGCFFICVDTPASVIISVPACYERPVSPSASGRSSGHGRHTQLLHTTGELTAATTGVMNTDYRPGQVSARPGIVLLPLTTDQDVSMRPGSILLPRTTDQEKSV